MNKCPECGYVCGSHSLECMTQHKMKVNVNMTNKEKIRKLAKIQLKLLETTYAGIITKPKIYLKMKEELKEIIL